MVVVLCLGGFLKKKINEQTFEKNSLCLLEKHLNFLSTQISSFYQNFRKKMFQKMSCIRTKRILERCPILRNFDKFKKVQKKFLTSA